MANSASSNELHSITKHNNIVISGVGSNEVLKFDGSNWINQTLAEAGIAPVATPTFTTSITIGSATVTEAQLEILDGATVSTAELNLLDGVSGLVQSDFTKLAAINSTATELNLLDALDRGSILYGNASGVTTVLGQGGTDTVLTSDGTDIAWQAAAGASLISCGLNHNADRAIASGSLTTIPWNTEVWDTDTMHSTVSNTERITFTTAGVYVVQAQVQWGNNSSGKREAQIRLNGGDTTVGSVEIPASGGGSIPQNVFAIYNFSATDYVTVIVYQNSGSSVNVESPTNSSGANSFRAVRVG